jgi:formylglycine-generating enzyme required for sulfatase activity
MSFRAERSEVEESLFSRGGKERCLDKLGMTSLCLTHEEVSGSRVQVCTPYRKEESGMRANGYRRAAWGRRLGSPALALLAAPAGWSGAGEEATKERVVDLGGGVKVSLVLIPAGTFTMGSTEAEIKAVLTKWPDAKEEWLAKEEWFAEEKPAHKVTLSKAFWVGKHEVMVGQFRRFVEATGYKTDAEKGARFKGAVVFADGNVKIAEDASWWNPYFKQTDDHPVVCVSRNDARAFVDWLNATDKAKPAGASYRLPTEAEWEYACRAGTTTWYQWGDDPDKGKGWCNAADLTAKKTFPDWTVFNWDDGFLYTAPVGSFKANAFGLHDMHGNVWEWCQDWYGPYQGGDQTDPSGAASGVVRVVRGGSWYGLPWLLRSACRNWNLPGTRLFNYGFRLVLAPGPR